MQARIEGLWRRRWVQSAGDALLALALAVTSVVPVLAGDPSWGHAKPLGVLLALLSTGPVAFRARWPLSAATLVLLANAGCVYAASPHQAAFQPFVALVLVFYSAGSRAEGRRALWAPPALAGASIPMFVAAVAHGQDAGNAIPSFVWLIAAWVAGRSVRSWRGKSVALERANRQLDAQRELSAQAAVMVERGRIARELHDVIAHNVSMMVVQAAAAARVLTGEGEQARAALEVIASTGRQTVEEMRSLLGVLRSEEHQTARAPQPGLGDLDRLILGVREAGLPVSLRIEGEPRPLPQALDLSAFRIVQEGLTNALKHAGPAEAEVVVRYADSSVELQVVDTGRRQAGVRSDGHGLVGMRERVTMFGGELDAAPAEEGGFAVRARLPLAPATSR